MKLLTHLNFPGNCAQAFHYYEDNLGGTHPTSSGLLRNFKALP
jgi:uncharacterized glyoxalase superfamily protein PhnB